MRRVSRFFSLRLGIARVILFLFLCVIQLYLQSWPLAILCFSLSALCAFFTILQLELIKRDQPILWFSFISVLFVSTIGGVAYLFISPKEENEFAPASKRVKGEELTKKDGRVSKKVKRHNINSSSSFARNKGDLIFYCLILLIPLAQILVFYFGVNTQNFLMAFQTYSPNENKFYWDTVTNINRFLGELKDKYFWIMVRDSFAVYLCTQLAGTVFALFFSYYIYKKRTLYKFFKFVLFLPSIIPGILLVFIFKYFMNEAVPAFLQLRDPGLLNHSNTYFWIVTAYTVWVSFGSQVLIYSGAMDQIPNEIIEAGKLDGAGSFREFISIVVPFIIPSVTTFIIAGVATIFTNQNNLYSFFGNGESMPLNDKTIGYYLFYLINSSKRMSNYCYASLLGLVSTCVAVPLTFVVRKVVSLWGDR